jgi:hypothetical protein
LSFSETNCTWIPGVMNAVKPYIISNSETRVAPHVSDWEAVFSNSSLSPQKIEKFKKAFADKNITDNNLFDLTREQIEAFEMDYLSFKEKFSMVDFVESYNKSCISGE